MLTDIQGTLERMEMEAIMVERARREKRGVSVTNKENKDSDVKMARVSAFSRGVMEEELFQVLHLSRRSAEFWLTMVMKLPERFHQKILHIIWWDFGGEGVGELLKHQVEDVDTDELAVALYSIGYTATRALARAKCEEEV